MKATTQRASTRSRKRQRDAKRPESRESILANGPRFYSLRQLQKALSVSYHTLRAAIDDGTLRAVQLPGHKRKLTVPFGEVERYLAKREGAEPCETERHREAGRVAGKRKAKPESSSKSNG